MDESFSMGIQNVGIQYISVCVWLFGLAVDTGCWVGDRCLRAGKHHTLYVLQQLIVVSCVKECMLVSLWPSIHHRHGSNVHGTEM